MINRAELNIKDRLVNQVAALERQLNALKSTQLIGADSLVVNRTGGPNVSVTLAAGAYQIYQVQFTGFAAGGVNAYYLSELGYDLYVTNDADLTYLWPVGANVVGDLEKLAVTPLYAPASSNELGTGMKTYNVKIENTGVSPKTIFMHFRLLYFATTLS